MQARRAPRQGGPVPGNVAIIRLLTVTWCARRPCDGAFTIGSYIRRMSSDVAALPPDLGQRVMGELQPGERVVYAGRPDWRAEWFKLAAIFVFGVGWSAISFPLGAIAVGAAFGLFPLTSGGGPAPWWVGVLIVLFALPFVAIGIGTLAVPFLGIAKSRRTVHVVTNRRILNVYGGRKGGADSYPLDVINFVKRRDRRDGTGSLEIGYGTQRDSDGDVQALHTDWSGIPDVRRAEAAMRVEGVGA